MKDNPAESEPENPPAFPAHSVSKEPGTAHFQVTEGGMSLRDFFAAKAMAAFVRDEPAASNFGPLARISYIVADAMLVERARQKGAR